MSRADIADAVNQLIRPRPSVEYVEVVAVEAAPAGKNQRRKAKRTRRRVAHRTTLPPLLTALRQALVPGSTGEAGAPAGFESRPAAELGPATVLRVIADGTHRWARDLDSRRRGDLEGTLSALVGADATDDQLDHLERDLRGWIKAAKLAVGEDLPPRTLGDPCVYCSRRNSLVITGDMQAARCTRCGVQWDVDTIGLLAEMLRANQEREVMADIEPRCWMADCDVRGVHERHSDGAGRTWRREDRCVDEDGRGARGLTA